MSISPETRTQIESILQQHRVVLFMKGTRARPQCGFSASACGVLDELLPDYHTVDVLQDMALREGIKAFGNWPTIPQLYIGGELVGGSDIIQQMYASGELQQALGVAAPDRTPPTITISDKAAEAIRAGMAENPGAALHLRIGADRQAAFRLAPAGPGDIVAQANGLDIHLDPGSAQRARGISIDWVESVQGAGLSLSFPGSAAH